MNLIAGVGSSAVTVHIRSGVNIRGVNAVYLRLVSAGACGDAKRAKLAKLGCKTNKIMLLTLRDAMTMMITFSTIRVLTPPSDFSGYM